MTSLVVADELSEVYTELGSFRNEKRAPAQSALGASDLEKMATRIESIADKLEAH
jgi:hypothetical protein